MKVGTARCWGTLVLLSAGCQPDLPPPREQDVVDALVEDLLVPMGDVVVVSQPSDCRRTRVSVPPAAWTAFLAANRRDAAGLDLGRFASTLALDASGAEVDSVRARQGAPVVSLSRVGLADNDALMCIEIHGAGDRGFYLLFHRDGSGRWTRVSEVVAWQEAAEDWELPPEELPDGTVYEE